MHQPLPSFWQPLVRRLTLPLQKAMSGSSTPTSAGSYTEAEMVAKLGVAADSSDYFKVKEISELLRSKGVTPRGKKLGE